MEKLSITSNTTTPKTPSKWSNPPKDILSNLLRYIDLTIDLPRIRAVNPSWRSSLPLSEIPILPSGLPVPPLGDKDDKSGPSLLLVESRFYLISPLNGNGNAKPWLAKLVYLGPGKWHLLNPFNLQDYFHSLPSINGQINLLDCNVVEVARPWSLIGKSGGDSSSDSVSEKVVGGWNIMSDYIFAVLVQLESGGGLVFKRLRDEEWVRFEDDKSVRMLDIGYFDGKFYAFELTKWKVGVIDPEKSSISMEFMDAPGVLGEVIDGTFSVLIDGCIYLLNGVYFVPSKTKLYLVIAVTKVGSKIVNMIVFVVKEGGWERVTSLGDETLFIGKDVSFGVSNLGIWKEGSICMFTRPFPMLFDGCIGEFGGMPEGVECIEMLSFPRYWLYLKMYNMEEEERGIVGFEDLSMEEYTGLFFPPPTWVKWRCPSLENVEVLLHNVKFSDDMFGMMKSGIDALIGDSDGNGGSTSTDDDDSGSGDGGSDDGDGDGDGDDGSGDNGNGCSGENADGGSDESDE